MIRLLAILLFATAAVSPDVAYVSDLRGAVERRPAAGDPWAVIGLDESVRLRDEIRTGERSLAELRFVDGTVLALGEKTRMRISLALFDPEHAPPEIRVALLSGEVDVRVGTARLVVEDAGGAARDFAPGDAFRLRLPGLERLPPGDGVTTDFGASPPPLPPHLPAPGEIGPATVPGIVHPLQFVPVPAPGAPILDPGAGGAGGVPNGGGAGGSGGAPPPPPDETDQTGIRVRVRVR